MNSAHYYEVGLKWNDHRVGTLTAPGLPQSITVATPPQFPEGIDGIWSPEHLFVAAINSCYMTTFLAIANNSKLPFKSFDCNASGKLEMVNGKYLVTEVMVYPKVVITDENDRERTERILQKTESNCLISNSVKSSVGMKIEIVVDAKIAA